MQVGRRNGDPESLAVVRQLIRHTQHRVGRNAVLLTRFQNVIASAILSDSRDQTSRSTESSGGNRMVQTLAVRGVQEDVAADAVAW